MGALFDEDGEAEVTVSDWLSSVSLDALEPAFEALGLYDLVRVATLGQRRRQKLAAQVDDDTQNTALTPALDALKQEYIAGGFEVPASSDDDDAEEGDVREFDDSSDDEIAIRNFAAEHGFSADEASQSSSDEEDQPQQLEQQQDQAGQIGGNDWMEQVSTSASFGFFNQLEKTGVDNTDFRRQRVQEQKKDRALGDDAKMGISQRIAMMNLGQEHEARHISQIAFNKTEYAVEGYGTRTFDNVQRAAWNVSSGSRPRKSAAAGATQTIAEGDEDNDDDDIMAGRADEEDSEDDLIAARDEEAHDDEDDEEEELVIIAGEVQEQESEQPVTEPEEASDEAETATEAPVEAPVQDADEEQKPEEAAGTGDGDEELDELQRQIVRAKSLADQMDDALAGAAKHSNNNNQSADSSDNDDDNNEDNDDDDEDDSDGEEDQDEESRPAEDDDDDEDLLGEMPDVEKLKNLAVHSGALRKRHTQKMKKNWKVRWCVLTRSGSLFWAKSASEDVPLGSIKLRGTDTPISIERLSPNEFEIRAKKTFIFQAADEKQCTQWFSHIDRAVQKGAGPVEKAGWPPLPEAKKGDSSLKLLTVGTIFKKFKHRGSKKRMIWCPAQLDRILWGDMKKSTVRGFIMIDRITDIKHGCTGSQKQDLSFTIRTPERNLELEAKTPECKQQWLEALKLVVFRLLAKRQQEASEA